MVEAPENLPSGAGEIAQTYPAIWKAYAALGKACAEAQPSVVVERPNANPNGQRSSGVLCATQEVCAAGYQR